MQRQLFLAALTVGLFALASSNVRGAGSNVAEEATIRKLIATLNTGTLSTPEVVMPDVITWSGAYKRPTVGDEKGEPFTDGADAITNRVPGSQNAKTEVIRIVVADSRDLAYEYGTRTLEYDLKTGGHRRLVTGLLRVWQKQNGEWKMAASFSRPYDFNFAIPPVAK